MNIGKAVTDNVPEAMAELEAERAKLVARIHDINLELATLHTLTDVVVPPTAAAERQAPVGGEVIPFHG